MTTKMKRDLFISEEYWNESEKMITPFDFEDDSEGYAFMKSFKEMRLHPSPEEEKEEIIGWNGKSVHSPDTAAAAARGRQVLTPPPLGGPGIAATPAPPVGAPAAEPRTLADAVTVSPAPPPPEPAQLAAELAFLRRRLAEVRQTAPPAAETARRLTLGEPCPLELYRPLADKRQLLADTVRLGDGDAMLAVVLFMKNTLKRSLFHRELRLQPEACEQYLAYLRARYSYSDAIDLLTMLGRVEEAAMVKYEAAVKTKDIDQRVKSLQNCLQTHFWSGSELEPQADLVRQHIDLLERQRPVEAADSARSAGQLVGSSVLTTLHYCCVHHYGEPANHLASPQAVRERHQLSDRQFVWTALRARASLQAWADVQALFTSKTWFSGGKLRAVVPFESAVEVLESFGASPDVLSVYISSVDSSEKRITLAKKYNCHKIVVDWYVSQKDRAALDQYRTALTPSSAGHQYASDALRAATVRWKN